MDALMNFGSGIFGGAWPAVWSLVKIVLIVAPLMLGVAYLTWAERKVIGYMQVRIGPNRVGPWGLIQPIADGLKLLLKEIMPSGWFGWRISASVAIRNASRDVSVFTVVNGASSAPKSLKARSKPSRVWRK